MRDTPMLPTLRRRLLLASVSALALLGALPAGEARAQSPLARRGAVVDPAAAAARAMQAQSNESLRAAQYAQNAMQVFARAAQATAAMSSLQAAARGAALAAPAPGVANGLAAGGLVPDPARWVGAAAPVADPAAAMAAGRSGVTVRQTEARAILTWSSFNVGRETDLRFDQSAGGSRAREWAVLNRVEDVTAQPSRILGSIRAEGQVYVVNRNGVIFGGSAQVNVATLIASALDVGGWSDDVAARDARFLAGLLPQPGAGNYAPAMTLDRLALLREGGVAAGAPRRVAVEVEAGAQITLRDEGSAILAAPQVRNAGSIAAPNGQVILAAGAGLRLDTPSGSPFAPRIGLEAEPLRRGAGADTLLLDQYPNEARNEGVISAPRGNVTLTGFLVTNAPGAVLSATTGNNRPGSVLLVARDQGGTESLSASGSPLGVAAYRFGEVTLAPGSLVEIPAATGAGEVVFNTATAAFEQSRLAFVGAAVRAQEGSVVRAPSASLRIAGDLPRRVFSGNETSGGRLQMLALERDAVFDLGGLKDLTAPVARNLVEVQTFRSELRDAPVQRDGFLYAFAQRQGRVTIDARIGSAIVDWQPTANSIPVSVAERQGPGGSVEVAAERVFVVGGARIDVSGGLLTWQGGMRPATTRLLGADGRIYDIGTAPADIAYVGLPGELTRTQPRWGVAEKFRSPLLAGRQVEEAGYVEGFDGGSVTISGRFYGDGVVRGGAFLGDRQRADARANDGDARTSADLPSGGALSFVAFRAVDSAGLPVSRSTGISGLVNPVFQAEVANPLPADFAARLVPDAASTRDRRYRLDGDPIPESRFDSVLSVRDVVGTGWSSVTINADGQASLPEGTRLALPAGGRLSINAWSAFLGGEVVAPGGAIAVTANAGGLVPRAAETLAAPALLPLRDGAATSSFAAPPSEGVPDGAILVGPAAVVSAGGRWANDLLGTAAGGPAAGRAFLDGGSIALQTRFTPYLPAERPALPADAVVDSAAVPVAGRELLVRAGAVLDVAGGGLVSASGGVTAGRGGTLTLGTYAGVAASPTGAPLPRGALAAGDVGYVVTGRFARPVVEEGALLRGFGTAREGAGAAANGLGGTLSLSAPAIAVGRAAATAADEAAGILVADLGRFAAAGFADLRLTAVIAGRAPFLNLPAGGLSLAPGAVIAPVAASQVLSADHRAAPTGAPAAEWSVQALAAPADRGPMRLSFAAQGALDAGDALTVVRADPGGARSDAAALVSLASARAMLVRGTLEAPAGQIVLRGTGPAAPYVIEAGAIILREIRGTEFAPGDALWIASSARLLAPGVAQSVPAAGGLLAGGVRAGGSITLEEGRGYLVVESGALLDVSGVAGATSLAGAGGMAPREAGGGGGGTGLVTLAGDAGGITLSGARGAFLDGTLRALPGGANAAGGSLVVRAPTPITLQAGSFAIPTPVISVPANLAAESGILVRQGGVALAPGAAFGAAIDPSLARTGPLDWTGGARTDRAFLAADALAGSGIGRVHLAAGGSSVLFEGDVALRVPRDLQVEARQVTLVAAPGQGAPPTASAAARYLVLNGSNFSPPVPTGAASGSLTLSGGWVDVLGGVALRGAARVTIASATDLRLIGAQPDAGDAEVGRVTGTLASQGDLTLRAAQVYPATATSFALLARGAAGEPGRTLRFETPPGSGAPPVAPLSAAGILTVTAEVIEQAGIVRAPQGQLTFRPGTRMEALAGSLTSVSAEGRTVPFGALVSDQGPLGVEYYAGLLAPGGDRTAGLSAPPEKAIELLGPSVLVRPGATIDASGGGELLAFRFLPGPGGSRDVLARAQYAANGVAVPGSFQFADRRDVFAILPGGTQPLAAAYSPFIQDSGTSLGRGDVTAMAPATGLNVYGQQVGGTLPGIGDQITIAATGIPGLAAGTYTLLPARYALLPGAFRVVVAPSGGAAPRTETALGTLAVQRGDGSWLAGGRRGIAGTGILEDRERGLVISPQSAWSRFSTLEQETASGFFTRLAARLEQAVPRLPADAGRLTLAATEAVALQGATRFGRGAGMGEGRGGQVEIAADRIAVTPGGLAYADPAFLPLSDAALSALGAETLTIGGRRTPEATGGERLAPGARAVTIAAGARLQAPEILLMARAPAAGAAAGDGLRLEAGAALDATAAAGAAAAAAGPTLRLDGDGAVLRVAAPGLGQAVLVRTNLPATGAGTGLLLGAGVRVAGGGSALLDATGASSVAPDAVFRVQGLDLVGTAIALGDGAPGGALGLGTQLLQGLGAVAELALRSRGAIDVLGPVTLRAGSLTLDAAALRGLGADAALGIEATRRATLRNAAGATAAAGGGGGGGSGTLAVSAGEEIVIGGGDLAVTGFGATRLATPGQVTVSGTGSLSVPGALAVTAARIAGAAGADVTLRAGGAVELAAPAGGPLAGAAGLGARFAVEAASGLALGTRLEFPAGTVALSTVSGDLSLGGAATIAAGGLARDFYEERQRAPGGNVALTAMAGSVLLAAGAVIDTAAAPGGAAGSLSITAQQGGAALAGAVLSGGGFALDVARAVDLGPLNAALDAGGFADARSIHTRAGDLALAAGSTMRAGEIGLTADGGRVLLGGLLDASGPRGGRVALYGRDLVQLDPGASVLARGTGAGRPGGTVEIGTAAGPLQLLPGSSIDVGGHDALRGSLVRFRLPEAALPGSSLAVGVAGARRVEVEPVRVLDNVATVGAAAIAAAFDALAGQGLRAAYLGGAPANWRVTPGVELRNAGDMLLAAGAPIDLRGLRTPGADADPGVLTLRAGGDLTILASISDGFTGPSAAATQTGGRSWSIRLVAGAETGSADPLATTRAAGSGAGGSLLIGQPWAYTGAAGSSPATNPVTVRTGTGSIDLAAARDVLLRDPDATVYTAGRPIADRNWVSGTDARGQAARRYFWDPVYPSFGFYAPNAPAAGDPSVPEAATGAPAAYPEEGGDLRVLAGRDVRATVLDPEGANAGQVASAWLWRQGAVDEATGGFLYRPAIAQQWRVFNTTALQGPVAERTSQTSWWINFSRFNQNFGVLGGGDATVRAGRDVQASVSIPTTGRTGGGLLPGYDFSYLPRTGRTATTVTGATPAEGQGPAVLSVDGGGDLMLRAGRNIGAASQFLLGRGEGAIRAGGSVLAQAVRGVSPGFGTPLTATTVGAVLAPGDARIAVTAGGGIAATIYDPFQAPAGRTQQISDSWGYGGTGAVGSFSGYGADAGVTLTALGGDATLLGSTSASTPLGAVTALRAAPRGRGTGGALLYRDLVPASVFDGLTFNFVPEGFGESEALPPDLTIAALSGSIGFQRTGAATAGRTIELRLQPAAEGQLALLAAGSIRRPTVTLADADPAFLATPARPFYGAPVIDLARGRTGPDNRGYVDAEDPVEAPAVPLRAGDPERSVLYTLAGDIDRPVLDVAKRIGVHAGRDITDMTAVIQHALPGDLSFLRAGRDIGTRPDPTLLNVAFGNTVEVRGPGRLQLLAGRDIAPIRPASNVANPALGPRPADNGLRSTGNAANLAFPDGGAAIDILFGLGTGPGFDSRGFLEAMLAPPAGSGVPAYRVSPTSYANGGVTWSIQAAPGAATPAAVLDRVRALPEPERLALAIDLFFREIDASGREAAQAAAALRNADYGRGFSAIATLFPYGGYAGNLNLQSTYVRTAQGGDINVLGPGGDFFLGAISATADRFPDRIGVLTLGYGSINVFAHGDIQVGQSRVITADGGDILMWSSTADINAGLGSRTARFVPPFQVSYLPDGTRVPDRAGLVTGSGIATYAPLTAVADVPALQAAPADAVQAAGQAEEARRRTVPRIGLVAPVGAVDFGDAGVRAAGDLNVAARTVLNAANVQVAGTQTGVPTVQAPNVGAAVSAAATAGQAASAASEISRQATRSADGQQRQDAPSVITVEIVAVGGSEQDAAGLR